MNILVAGGAGYIGSHTCLVLLEAGHQVIVADNLSNSKQESLRRVEELTGRGLKFYLADVTDEQAMENIFTENTIDGIIHFAGLKAVGESVEQPLRYYHNNVVSTMVLCKMMERHGVDKFVFSSSATVYGDNEIPFVETMALRPTTNPYGQTKVMSEQILRDTGAVHPQWSIALLRYFNPVGAHHSGRIGEDPQGIPNNLMPYISQVASGRRDALRVWGNDYPTVDGTGVRDYIHVMDLAEGHVKALEQMERQQGVAVYNLGTGKGTSVLEMVHAFEQVNGLDIPYEIKSRRAGDIAEFYADAGKAQRELGWQTTRTIEDMCRDTWNWQRHNPNGYEE